MQNRKISYWFLLLRNLDIIPQGGESMEEETNQDEIENVDEISKLTKDTEALETLFKEPTTLLREMQDSLEKRSYTNTLEGSKKVLEIMDAPMHEFMKMGMAISISAASRWASTLGEVGVDISHVEELIAQARDQFSSEDFKEADETIGKVRELIPRLEDEEKTVANEALTQVEHLIDETRVIGASVTSAERALNQAKNLMEVGNYPQVARLTQEAKEEAEASKRQRIQTTSDALLITRSIIEESRDIGVDVKEPEALFKKAKNAFGKGEFVKCAEYNKQSEELALKLQDEHLERVMQLKEKRESMKKERETAQPKQPESEKKEEEPHEVCPTCESEVRFVTKYNRYWCKECKKYTPKK
jgi:putative cell wall-binding protein